MSSSNLKNDFIIRNNNINKNKMEFCDICNNMIYIKSSECSSDIKQPDKEKEIQHGYNPKLIKYCKHCLYEKEEPNVNAIKISETIYTEDDLLYNQNINRYLRFDPSLRRIKDDKIKCDKCDIPDDKRQIIPIKYHPTHMKYFYVCDNCGHTWRENKK
jgi:DNA-directed RNA polymerase subunit M/transcription elongation factor TFIIS